MYVYDRLVAMLNEVREIKNEVAIKGPEKLWQSLCALEYGIESAIRETKEWKQNAEE